MRRGLAVRVSGAPRRLSPDRPRSPRARCLAYSYDDGNFTPPYLSTITAETLIVFGDRDPLYPVSIAVEMHRAIPRSYLWVVPNGAHGPIFGDAAPQFVKTALQFLGGS